MATFLGTHLEFIELNDTTWRNKVNSNFTVLAATQVKTANYTVDSSPPTNATSDNVIIANSDGGAFKITLPALGIGKAYTIVKGGTNTTHAITVGPHSGGKINNGSVDATITITNAVGAAIYIWCDGTQWLVAGNYS